MSHVSASSKTVKVTTQSLQQMKANGEKIAMVTCYDAAFGRIVALSPVEVILVGDSLGNVMLGHESTVPVTIQDMIHHSRAVTRVTERQLIIADMPFLTYGSVASCLQNAARLMQEGRVHGVKVEGGVAICQQVRALVDQGIPVMGHLGLTPQSIHTIGGYKVQGRSESQRAKLIEDALALQDAGAFAIVLEMVPAPLAKEVTAKLSIPTIGIGAGPDVDGQVLVLHDLLGFDPDFKPKFLKTYAQGFKVIHEALGHYASDVKSGQFPDLNHSFQS
jgi:3-methyl-2-oxobutanoate hydroxymethyltransferase